MSTKRRKIVRVLIVVGAAMLFTNFEYSYSVESPSDCPPAWEGQEVVAQVYTDRTECAVYVFGGCEDCEGWSTIPWGNRSGLWPHVAPIWVIAGGWALWRVMTPWVERGP